MSKIRVNDILPANGLNIGIGTAGGNFIVGGASTTVVVNGGVNATGSVTASTFIGDGSGITGVTASGTGIAIKDSSSIVGVAGTIDFGTNLNVSPASAGIVTVTVGDTDFAIADKIVHTGDTDTAIRFPAADTITAETGGSERLRINSSGFVGIGTDNLQALLHLDRDISAGYEHVASLAHGADRNFKLVTSNGSTTNSSGEPVSRLGMHYQGTGWDAYAEWRRGSTAQDGSLRFVTSGGTYTPLILNANGTSTFGNTINGTSVSLTSNITQTGSAPQHFFKETGSTYGNTLWSLTRDSDSFSIRWNNAAPYAFRTSMSGGNIQSVFLRHSMLEVSSTGANVNGAFVANSKSFRIAHPLSELSETRDLMHVSIESSQADLIYRGVVDLIDGTATVNIDTVGRMTEGTFAALCTNVSCFTSNETDWTAVKGSVSGNILTINAQDNSSTATISWMVVGERKDQHMIDADWTDDNGRVVPEQPKRVIPE